MKRVRILLRVSSGQQLEADGDLSIQRQLVTEYVSRQKDWILDQTEYFEGSKSGYKTALDKRDTLQKALEDAQRGEYDILAVYKDDRIGRRMWEIGAYVMALKSCGVDIYTVRDGCISPESGDIMGQMMLALRYGNAQKSSSDTGMRVKDTAGKMIRQGKFMGGPPPYGYRLVLSGELSKHGRALHRLEILPEQAQIVRYICYLYLYRELGCAKIARILNEEPSCREMAPNEVWKSGTIANILSNPIYAGYAAYKRREKAEGKSQRQSRDKWILAANEDPKLKIIEMEQWNRIQKLRDDRARFYGRKTDPMLPSDDNHKITFSAAEEQLPLSRYPSRTHFPDGQIPRHMLPLTDVIYCGCCGNKMTGSIRYSYWTLKSSGEKRSRHIPLYRCPAAQKGIPHIWDTQLRADRIEPVLFRFLAHIIEALQKNTPVSTILSQEYARKQQVQESKCRQFQKESAKITQDIAILEGQLPKAMTGNYPLSLTELADLIRRHRKKLSDLELLIQKNESSHRQSGNLPDACQAPDPPFPLSWQSVFYHADKTCQRLLVNLLISRIDVTKTQIIVLFKTPYPE